MPLNAVSISLTVVAAAGIPFTAAVAATAAPAPDSFTCMGAALAVFCIVCYIRMQRPSTSVWMLFFNVVCTLSVGWIFPEVIVHSTLPSGTVVSNKGWAAIAFILGLLGGAAVQAVLALRGRIPYYVDRAASRVGLGEPPTVKLSDRDKLTPSDEIKESRGKRRRFRDGDDIFFSMPDRR